jgi:hypothetical protein
MADLTPDLAAKLLATDLRNIVKKVAEGGNLSPAEREAMERAILTGDISVELQQARQAALIRKWANGGKLNQDELLEMGSVIPDPRQVAKRVTSDKYAHSYTHYVTRLKAAGMADTKDAEGKIKKWVKKGRYNDDGSLRDPLDLPPFDQLDKLAEWWRRHMKWRVPDFILSFEQGGTPADSTAAASSTAGAAAPGSKPSQPGTGNKEQGTDSQYIGMSLDAGQEGGESTADMGLVQARALVKATYEQMERALQYKKFTEYNSLRREWQQLVQTLRQWEKDIIKIQEGKGEVLRTRTLLEDANRMFAMLSISFTNCLEDLVRRLAPDKPAPERKEMVLAWRDNIFEHLQTTQFASAWVPPEAAAA